MPCFTLARNRSQARLAVPRQLATGAVWLNQPVTAVKGVGPQVAARLERLHIQRVQDLCLHLPLRYEDRTRLTSLRALRAGIPAQVEGYVTSVQVQHARKPVLLVELTDDTRSVVLRFFNFSNQQKASLQVGARLRCFGEPRWVGDRLGFIHPQVKVLHDAADPLDTTLTPVYPATEGLGQTTLRRLIQRAMAGVMASGETAFAELIPPEILHELQLPPLLDALRFLHGPPPDAPLAQLHQDRHPAQHRMVLEELLSHYLALRRLRQQAADLPAPPLVDLLGYPQRLLAQLPFAPTRAQQRVWCEILEELGHAHPMQRLLQGDVGAGKTLVAALAMLHTVGAGYQTVLLAPTELLAEQHHRNLAQWLAPLGIEALLLSGSLPRRLKQQALARAAAGDVSVIVGTHALLQPEVQFHKLALAVVDEQHRFGVEQRLALRRKGERNGWVPHQLVMSATPIPRTLAMAFYGDLDVSVLDELPPGRTPVDTVLVSQERRGEVVARIRAAIAEGRQVYWVCPLVEESEVLQVRAATEAAQWLRGELTGVSVGLVHGRLRSEQKDAVMRAFRAGEVRLLVATTVIEVGVDVPQASLMVIENAERLGLAQLHQLRGRVGRGRDKSACVLLYRGPLGEIARQRLMIMRQTNDGFEIARRDLEMRGPGEVLGTRQSGVLALRVADLLRDQDWLPWVEKAAALLFTRYPERVELLIQRWLGGVLGYGTAA